MVIVFSFSQRLFDFSYNYQSFPKDVIGAASRSVVDFT